MGIIKGYGKPERPYQLDGRLDASSSHDLYMHR